MIGKRNTMDNNIILIGMPSCGKSTIGKELAKRLGYAFIDTDDVIVEQNGCELRDIIRREGLDGFRRREEEACCCVNVDRTVIATGGSVVYSDKAMQHLCKLGKVVYLVIPFDTLKRRIGGTVARGVAMAPDMTLLDLYNERLPLYERYAALTLEEANDDTVCSAAEKLADMLK